MPPRILPTVPVIVTPPFPPRIFDAANEEREGGGISLSLGNTSWHSLFSVYGKRETKFFPNLHCSCQGREALLLVN